MEGYTSLLWILLLELIWRVVGVEPPESANWVSLLFGYATLAVTFLLLRRMRLPERLERYRTGFIGLAMLGILTNRTFLAWLSSGLETALFNFLFIWWLYLGWLRVAERGRWWLLWFSASASLAALARPDGLLLCAASAALLLVTLISGEGGTLRRFSDWPQLAPFLAVPAHFAFRLHTYGTWLPNTYYAKYVAPWPESGIRYLASFFFEYGLWVWVVLALVWFAMRLIRPIPDGAHQPRALWHRWIVAGALATHLAYYTFVIGGDHFEYRVYSHLIPILFVVLIWLSTRLSARRWVAVGLISTAIVVSWPIPWVHWLREQNLTTRGLTYKMVVPIADAFPRWLEPVVRPWDEWQSWLIHHSVCMRHQEHKIFYQRQLAAYPTREVGSRIKWSQRGIGAWSTVGVPGWVLPEVAIIDVLGLNDHVIAHFPAYPHGLRQMAHERFTPPGYLACFPLNVAYDGTPASLHIRDDMTRMTDDDIRACENNWWH